MRIKLILGAAILALAPAGQAAATDELNVVCSNEQDWCDLMAGAFEEASGIEVAWCAKAPVRRWRRCAPKPPNPKIDVWWGGTGDPHLIAASEDLTQASGVDTSELLGWAVNMADISGGKTIGVHAGALGIAYNADLVTEKGLKPPACWRDLTDAGYRGEIQVANPNSSGTAYTELATFVQLFGEDEAFRLLAEIGRNANQYTKSGSAPSKAVARGETTISIGFMHDMVKLSKAGFPLKIVSLCEGTGYEVGGVSVIKGAKNPDAARKWVEFVLTAEAQSRGLEVGTYNVPSNSRATLAPGSPNLTTIKLIDYDFATYGAADTRERLLARWDTDVKNVGNQ